MTLLSSSSLSWLQCGSFLFFFFLSTGWIDHVTASVQTKSQVFLKYNLLPTHIPYSLSDHTANLVLDRFVYLVGGCNATLGNTLNSDGNFQCDSITDFFCRYDLVRGRFENLTHMPRPRYRHVAEVANNQIWVFGGRDLEDNLIPQVDMFDIDTNQWKFMGNLTSSLVFSDSGSFTNGINVYVAGGYDQNYTAVDTVFRVNALNSTITKSLQVEVVASLPTRRGDVGYTFDDDYGYIVGGFTDANKFCAPLGATERYTFANGQWESLSPLLSPRSDLNIAKVNASLLFALGGERQLPNICDLSATPPEPGERTIAVDDVEVYDITNSEKWTIIASLPEHRFRFESVVWNTTIYTFGGQFAFDASCNCYRTSNEVVSYSDETEIVITTITSAAPPPAMMMMSWKTMPTTTVLTAAAWVIMGT